MKRKYEKKTGQSDNYYKKRHKKEKKKQKMETRQGKK